MPLFIWFLIPTVLIVGIGVWFLSKPSVLGEQTDESKPAAVSNSVEGTVDYDIVGRQHIAQGTSGSGYNSNPPSSGPHWANPAKNGIHDQVLPDEQLIHDLEHGYVWIAYRPADAVLRSSTSSAGLKPGLSQDELNKLKEIVKSDDWKVVLAPRDKNEAMVALVAWGRVLVMDQFDEGKVKDFIKTYRNRGPESTPS